METFFFHKVLVANRGEIACRIFRTLRGMGLATVAVYSDADRDALHVAAADEAVRLGPAEPARSYLDPQAVIDAARATGAEAIHPGYGFLAENPDAAQRVIDQGLVWIGPSPGAMRRLADKAAAKDVARQAGVPVVDGFTVGDLDRAALAERAEALGYPLLVKAAAGGGGKGMRVVEDPAALDAALEAAAREAESAFGDGALLIERLLTGARHVEVQVLGDRQGTVVHLFERDCSLQRRHQKVLEEAPAPGVDRALRARLGEAAVAVARAVGYHGAGTVELLLDEQGAFFFLEMNARLQVEHPVTEAITGLDLVRLQVEIAQGLPLDPRLAEPTIDGHAIEARVYAEDPANGFLPSTGPLALWSLPDLPGVRVDSGVEAGDAVTVHYDPLLAKVIAHGRDRQDAARRLRHALRALVVGGVATNRDVLLAVLAHEAFARGEVDTAFLEANLEALAARAAPAAVARRHAIAATIARFDRRRRLPSPLPAAIPSGWRNNRWRAQEEAFLRGEARIAVRYVVGADGVFTIEPDGADPEVPALEARLVAVDGITWAIEIDGVRRRFQVAEHGADDDACRLSVNGMGYGSELTVVPRFPVSRSAAIAGGCAAPMTGRVVAVEVAEGDRVVAGTTLVVLEAMKMEHRLEAQTDGVVVAVRVEVGQMVDPDDVLAVVEPLEDEDDESHEGGA